MDAQEFIIESLVKTHRRAAFACGHADLDRYLREQARREQERGVARVYVLRQVATNRVAGYYTLSATSVETIDLPDDLARSLPRYRLQPAILLGRLARDLSFRGSGIGAILLRDALERSLRIQQTHLGAVAVIVDAIDEHAARFYESFGFIRLPAHPQQLFIALATVAQATAGR